MYSQFSFNWKVSELYQILEKVHVHRGGGIDWDTLNFQHHQVEVRIVGDGEQEELETPVEGSMYVWKVKDLVC